MAKDSVLKIGVVGYGYWGPNIVRNFMNTKGGTVVAVSDVNPNSQVRVRSLYPSLEVTGIADDILASPEIDAVAIVTPPLLQLPVCNTAVETRNPLLIE